MIIRLYNSIAEKDLEKYFLEITFYTPLTPDTRAYNSKHNKQHRGEYKCYLPVILMVKNRFEAQQLTDKILAQIINGDNSTDPYNLSFLTEDQFKIKQRELSVKLDGGLLGTLNTDIHTPVQTNNPNPTKFTNKFTIKDLINKKPENGFELSIVFHKVIPEE